MREWLRARWDRPAIVVARLALEALAGIALCARFQLGSALWAALAVLAARSYVVLRARPPDAESWVSRIAAVNAVILLAIVIGESTYAFSLVPQYAWMFVPLVTCGFALLTRPIVGLAFLAGAAVDQYGAGFFFGAGMVFALPVLAVHAVRTGSWRLPMTWALAGLAMTLACEAIRFDHEPIGSIAGHILHLRTGPELGLRLTAEATVLVAARGVLSSRTWALLALVAACTVLGALSGPHLFYQHSCMSPWFGHPLDFGQGDWFLRIALVLAAIWAAPVGRYLAARDAAARLAPHPAARE